MLKSKLYIGIDPGINMGVGVFDGTCFTTYRITYPEFRQYVLSLPKEFEYKFYVELLHAFPTPGPVQAYKFGKVCGSIEGFLDGIGFDYMSLQPSCWKRRLGIIGQGKVGSVNYIKEHYPETVLLNTKRSRVPNTDRADACCIALCGYYHEEGIPKW